MGRRLTTEEFIKKAREVHGDKYDYSKVEYISTEKKIVVICPIHGEFLITPHHHLDGHGCQKCSREHSSGLRTLTTEAFIRKAREVHGDKYDYSKVEYSGCETKVCIICPIHGEFWQKPSYHLSGNGCSECGRLTQSLTNLKTKDEWIQQARKVHGDKYDYSLVDYKKSNTKVRIICPIHGVFEQEANSHLQGKGCFKCAHEKIADRERCTREEFIEKARKAHGDKYDYSLVNYEVNKKKVTIICREHGEFRIKPLNHIQGQGCPECGRNRISESLRMPFEEFQRIANEVHDSKYTYDDSTYVSLNNKLRIICPKHGEFWQVGAHHIRGCGCQKCRSSKLERNMMKILNENNIDYIHQCRNNVFPWLKRQSLDFYLPKYNVAIECQGQQHFGLNGWGKNFNFIMVYENDMRKYNLLLEHNIPIFYYCFSDETWKVKLPFYTDDNIIYRPESILEKIGFYTFTE